MQTTERIARWRLARVSFSSNIEPMRRLLTSALAVTTAIVACSTHSCPHDLTENTVEGHVSIAGEDLSLPRQASGRLKLSDLADDHNEVLFFDVGTTTGQIVTSFRRPTMAGTSRFEDLVKQQWFCPPYTSYTQFGNPTPSCSGDDAGTIPAQLLALTGTVEMTDNDVTSSGTFDLTATLHLVNVTPRITIDALAHTRNGTIARTCTDDPVMVNTQ
jgi:hypothetical protein